MTALAFSCLIAVLFATVLAWESETAIGIRRLRPAGLLRWLASGNWPAKVGAALLVIGSGALLRYLMLQLLIPADVKLLAGVAISTGLGGAAGVLGANPQRRAIRLALAGAALGVAYLTAYSAYNFFHLLSGFQALGLLFLVAVGTTMFAIQARALSMAVLAMVGAYVAPAFALPEPSPLPVYGYYVLASLLTLLMVWQRGWRPLIHLSFLFTLAGALFFGWTQAFYTPAFYLEMRGLLLALVGLHLAMPFLEPRSASRAPENALWRQRFDLGYFLLLPLVAALLTLAIAPTAAREGALGLAMLAPLWLIAAAVQHRRESGDGAQRYMAVALLLGLLAAILALGHVSYFLMTAVAACALLAMGPQFGVPKQLDALLATAALASAACYLLQALLDPVAGSPFQNTWFVRHALLGLAFAASGVGMRRRGLAMASVFLALGGTWLAIASAREAIRLHLEYLPQAIHLVFLAATAVYAILLWQRKPNLALTILLASALFFSGLIAAKGFPPSAIVPLLLAGQLVFSGLAYLAGRHGGEGERIAGVARSLLPVLVLPWALAFDAGLAAQHASVVMTLLVASALIASLQAQLFLPDGRYWPNSLSPAGVVIFGSWLLYQTLFRIERQPWAVAYELIALVYLAQTVRFLLVSKSRDAHAFALATFIAGLSVLAAMFLRGFGPPGVLTILALNDMLLPAVVSLFAAGIGAVMAWWSTRSKSRRLWIAGALLLAGAASKLILFDFDSLGQLGNILAMMAAGGVFMLVAWLAPFPPKPESTGAAGAAESAPDVAPAKPVPPATPITPTMAAEMPGPPPTAARPNADLPLPGKWSEPPTASRGRGWIWLAAGLLGVGYFIHASQQRSSHRAALLPAQQSGFWPSEPEPAPTPPVASSERLAVAASEPPPAPPAKVANDCTRFAEKMPSDYTVYAAGGYAGSPLGHAPRAGGHALTGFDVVVDEPGRNVVLALGAYEPAVWTLRPTAATRIAGVIVSGYHQGEVLALPADVPVLRAAYEDRAPCGYFYLSESRSQDANKFVSLLLVSAVEKTFLARNGAIVIGGQAPENGERREPRRPRFGDAISCQVRPWNHAESSCSGAILAQGSMKYSDAPQDAARACEGARVGGSCCMFHLYGVGEWYLTDGDVQTGGRPCQIEGRNVSTCRAAGACSPR